MGFITMNRDHAGKIKVTKKTKTYWSYCERVRLCARQSRLITPVESRPDEPLMIFTRAFFDIRTHPDPENVHKGIKDALFYRARFGDKYTGGHYLPPKYVDRNPYVDVLVRAYVPEDEEMFDVDPIPL